MVAIQGHYDVCIIYLFQAMAIKAYPNNLSSSLERFATMVDDIWYYAGDRSTDFNWYTKRGILAAVYCTTGKQEGQRVWFVMTSFHRGVYGSR